MFFLTWNYSLQILFFFQYFKGVIPLCSASHCFWWEISHYYWCSSVFEVSFLPLANFRNFFLAWLLAIWQCDALVLFYSYWFVWDALRFYSDSERIYIIFNACPFGPRLAIVTRRDRNSGFGRGAVPSDVNGWTPESGLTAGVSGMISGLQNLIVVLGSQRPFLQSLHPGVSRKILLSDLE